MPWRKPFCDCASLDMDTFPSVVAHGVRLSSALVVEGSGPGPDASKQLVARHGHLSAVLKLKYNNLRNIIKEYNHLGGVVI